jgi:hypothetical protein
MMRTRAAISVTPLLVFALVACGSSSDATGGRRFTSARDVVDYAGLCDSVRQVKNFEALIDDVVVCRMGNHALRVGWFAHRAALKSHRDAGLLSGPTIEYGEDWFVRCPDEPADCNSFLAAVK